MHEISHSDSKIKKIKPRENLTSYYENKLLVHAR